MGFESQEEAERWYEQAELAAERLKEERLLNPKLNAWLALTGLPAYKDMSTGARELQKAVFDYAWEAAMKVKP